MHGTHPNQGDRLGDNNGTNDRTEGQTKTGQRIARVSAPKIRWKGCEVEQNRITIPMQRHVVKPFSKLNTDFQKAVAIPPVRVLSPPARGTMIHLQGAIATPPARALSPPARETMIHLQGAIATPLYGRYRHPPGEP